MVQKLALGTAQFGSNYGINNKDGKTASKEVNDLINHCKTAGMRVLDTAPAYGDSEYIIGKHPNVQTDFSIISKTPIDITKENVCSEFKRSLKRLNASRLYGYLIHHYDSYKKDKSIWEEMMKLRERGQVEKIGFSLYYPEEFDQIIKNGLDLNIVSIPYNIFDQRFESLLLSMKERNIEVYVRSVFLQGLFFMKVGEIGQRFSIEAKNKITEIKHLCSENSIPITAICLNFALLNENIDGVVIGVDSKYQLIQNLDCVKYSGTVQNLMNDIKSFKVDDEDIIIPMNWKV